jgi:GNAT superfamily N-acetyltransferase
VEGAGGEVVTGADGTVGAVPSRDHVAGATPSTPAERLVVERVPPAETYDLRGRVLRPGAPPDRVRFDVDDRGDTAAFAARDATGAVVGTAIVYPEPCRWAPDRPGAWRLRGMATAEDRRGAGVGGRVLAAVLAHVADEGGALVWCNARVPARRFYERAGFVAHGEEWVDPEIGPHVAMWRDVAGSGGLPGR